MPADMRAQAASRRAPRRTRSEQAEFYELLVQTSLRLFADGGYEAISMRRLAAEVGVPPMTLYRYFPTKTHLVRHVWDHILVLVCERCTEHAPASDDPFERLRCFLDAFVQYWLDHRDHYWVVFSVRDLGGERLDGEAPDTPEPDLGEFSARFEELFDDCVPRHRWDGTTRRAMIDLALCKVLGVLLGPIGLVSLGWTDPQRLKQQMLDDVLAQVLQAAGRRPPRRPGAAHG